VVEQSQNNPSWHRIAPKLTNPHQFCLKLGGIDVAFLTSTRGKVLADWFSEEAVQRLRFLVTGFKRFHGLSNAKLASILGNQRIGPSASTFKRFLEIGDEESELSLRHAREVRANLAIYLANNRDAPETKSYIDSSQEDLAYFEICCGAAIETKQESTRPSDMAPAQPVGLEGKYIIARRIGSREYIFSLAVLSKAEPLNCRIHKLSCGDNPISMNCSAYSINSMVYIEGFNRIHDTIRFMCCSKFGPNRDVLVGFMTGFESLGIPFSARTLFVKIGSDTDPFPEITPLVEKNDIQTTEKLFLDMATNPHQAVAALKSGAEPGYMLGGSMHI